LGMLGMNGLNDSFIAKFSRILPEKNPKSVAN